MKNLALSLLAVGVFAAGGLKAQSVDEIVKKHNEAVGGEKAWKKVSSIVYTGSLVTPQGEFPVVHSILAGKGSRRDFEIMGSKNYVIVTASKGWIFMPIQGQTKPEEMKADDVKQQADELEIMDELMTVKDRGAKVELAGKESIDGKEAFKITYTDKNSKVKTFFVDPTSYYIVRQVSTEEMQGQSQEMVINLGDYKKLPEGVSVPTTIGTPNGDVKISKVDVNTIKDEKMFVPEG